MPGLDPGIHLFHETMDCRVKPGNDKYLAGEVRRVIDPSPWIV
jgi:hypothetical protein